LIPTPCARCGYHAPEPLCPHCASTATLRSLAAAPSGPLKGILDGLLAVPMGLWLLATTRGTKRWLVPPLLVTTATLAVGLWILFRWLSGLLGGALPDEIAFADSDWARWEWLERRGDGWGWLQATWVGLIVALQWVANALVALLSSKPLAWLGYLLVGSLVAWYVFSIVYEALAGPFLDEVHGRLERRWFGADPRSRMERPNAIPESRCWRRTMQASAGAAAVLLAGALVPGFPLWIAAIALPIPVLCTALLDREYGEWLVWMARVEGRAAWVSLQAAGLTAIVLVCALPLYFVPFGVGYVLFAGVTGFATAVSLLDIPLERRGLRLRQRLAFLFRYGLALVAFGAVAGLLLAIPLVGPVLMVPSASVGGLWLICRLDKGFLRRS
jgi:uncharacterized protein involved in cysteine biosynthesis